MTTDQNIDGKRDQNVEEQSDSSRETDATYSSEETNTEKSNIYGKEDFEKTGDKSQEGDEEMNEIGEKEIADYQSTIANLEKELEKTREGMLRKAAEFENLKRRTQKEKSHIFEDARADAISRFLPIREDLKRTLDASKGREIDQGFLEGVELVLANFERVLQEYNVEPIEETGVPFDVDKHDAMLSQPAEDDSVESNTVIQVLEPGYKIGDRVIKHAKVIVSQ